MPLPPSLPSILNPPDCLYFQAENDATPLEALSTGKNGLTWERSGIRLAIVPLSDSKTDLIIESSVPLRQAILRWNQPFPEGYRLLGDAWERSYGDLEWRNPTLHRLMPWYFLASDGARTTGYGVETGASSLACWQADRNGLTLTLDLRCGGRGVSLGSRSLRAATLVQQASTGQESPFATARSFFRSLCPRHLTPPQPIVGHNDWYWLYSKNSAALILEATRRFLDLYPKDSKVVPWSIIDDGWQTFEKQPGPHCNGGPWDKGNEKFPDMPDLANQIKKLGARPGLWMRPLQTKASVPKEWQIDCPKPNSREGGYSLDPSVPEVLDLVSADITRIRKWGYEMIKHDFSTFDITGRWGFEMQANGMGFAPDGWSFRDNTRTTAEIITDLYQTIRAAAGPEALLIGCNTVGHLAAGLVEIQRIGDDTSASDWDRTRRMGVNTLAFRSVQQDRFFAADADCIPISPHIPESLTNQWLDVVARSGTPLFLSIDPAACTASQTEKIREALAAAVIPSLPAEALDWFESAIPVNWNLQGKKVSFDWNEWRKDSTPPASS